jgi:glutamine synthetase
LNHSIFLEYIWLDGHTTPNLRSKTKIVKAEGFDGIPPVWNYDGSSTGQASGNYSECILQPVRTYKWQPNHFLVLCEVMTPDGSPHASNTRAKLRELSDAFNSSEYWWGFEQEYFLTKGDRPLGFPETGYPAPQGPYYCGVGGNQTKGRVLVEAHMRACLDLGIELTGINAEVAIGQWEFQCFSENTLKACDDLWVSRYLLHRMSEEIGYGVDLHPKPVSGDWNGSGCHTNFSTERMRTTGGQEYITNICESLAKRHKEHICEYGEGNENRLTGLHETQHIGQFSFGVADRGASIRIPVSVAQNNWTGYLEDRRPASNCDPYTVARMIVETTREVDSV